MSRLKYIELARVYHPGCTLREKLAEMQMSVKEFAVRTTKPEKTINSVLNGTSALTPDMAIAFETVTLIPAHLWMNLQREYDEFVARKKREELYCDKLTIKWAMSFPYEHMVEIGWLKPVADIKERIADLLSFFRITSVQAWEDYYINQELKVAFKLSLGKTKDPYAISAWLRKGDIEADKVSVLNSFSLSETKKRIPLILSLVKEQPENAIQALKSICSESGIKLILTDLLPNAPVRGCARWINGVPCIQMTRSSKKYDLFWFSFFHELGHILLHGKKEVFMDEHNSSDSLDKEREADRFASETLLDSAAERELLAIKAFDADVIRRFADQHNTHPAIVSGRLKYLNLISEDLHTEMSVIISTL
ncbi:MAG: HigA family addiction module antidote protein [Bacteroidales bacterium]|nr:HigA family addiction module antidote protein [Bacteroidales bacterium]MBQ9722789.1 HigA family addiction module antidote protein [Bacteroidales bacterium]